MDAAHRARLAHQENFVFACREHLRVNVFRGVAQQVHRERGVVLRRDLFALFDAFGSGRVLGRDRRGHARPGHRCDAVRTHVESAHVYGDTFRQRHHAQLGRAIVGLAHGTDQARGRGHVHQCARFLFAEMICGVA